MCLFWRFFQKYHACGYHGSGDKALSEPILRPKKACSARQARQVNLASLKPLLPMLDSHSIFEQILEISLFIYFVFWGVTGVFPLVRYLGTKVDSMTPRINKGHWNTTSNCFDPHVNKNISNMVV